MGFLLGNPRYNEGTPENGPGKRAQDVPTRVALPRVGGLTHPTYTGETTMSALSFLC